MTLKARESSDLFMMSTNSNRDDLIKQASTKPVIGFEISGEESGLTTTLSQLVTQFQSQCSIYISSDLDSAKHEIQTFFGLITTEIT